jgi:hypothetical protein
MRDAAFGDAALVDDVTAILADTHAADVRPIGADQRPAVSQFADGAKSDLGMQGEIAGERPGRRHDVECLVHHVALCDDGERLAYRVWPVTPLSEKPRAAVISTDMPLWRLM